MIEALEESFRSPTQAPEALRVRACVLRARAAQGEWRESRDTLLMLAARYDEAASRSRVANYGEASRPPEWAAELIEHRVEQSTRTPDEMRERARELRIQAENAEWPEVRETVRSLADQWDQAAAARAAVL